MDGIAQRFRETIKATRLSIEDFASSIEESRTRVTSVLRGKQRIPADMLAKVIEVYSVDANWLITGKQSPFNLTNDQQYAEVCQLVDTYLNLPDELRSVWISQGMALEKLAVDRGTARLVRKVAPAPAEGAESAAPTSGEAQS